MGIYNFRKRFVPFIVCGDKTHTIRAMRAHPDKPGNILHLYTGLRTKHTRLLMRVPCVKVEEIIISETAGELFVRVNGIELDHAECDVLAKRDGFSSWSEMCAFWKDNHTFPFFGHIIHWRVK